MSLFTLTEESVIGLDAAGLSALLACAERAALLDFWAPRMPQLASGSERVLLGFYRQCEKLDLFSELRARGFLEPGSRWGSCATGKWLSAKVLRASGDSKQALQLYREIIVGSLSVPLNLALEAAALAADHGELAFAESVLSGALRDSDNYNELQKASRIYQRLSRSHQLGADLPVLRVALLLRSATDFTELLLVAMAYANGFRIELFVPEFGSFESVIYDENSGLYEFNPQLVILGSCSGALDFESTPGCAAQWSQAQYAEIERHWSSLRSRCDCRIVQHTFDLPDSSALGHLDASEPTGKSRRIHELNAKLLSNAPGYVSLVDVGSLQARLDGESWNDARLWYAARQYPALGALPVLIREYLAIFRAYAGRSKKVLVLDLDHTLWGGVIGEDGLGGIEVGVESPAGEAFCAFQRYALELKQRGVLLAVCSKNDEAEARLPFEQHDGMVLRLSDFVAFKANWEPKWKNIKAIAQELNLSLDSFVLVDDNPVECAQVRSQIPELSVLHLPSDPAAYVHALHHVRCFESLAISDEDQVRSETYQQERSRKHSLNEAASVGQYLSGLEMVAQSGAFDRLRLNRIVQLIQRTNQFNLTSKRYSCEELESMMDDPGCWTRWFSLSDRFGDCGISGLAIVRIDPDCWVIDSFLMSCRVMGRGFEEYMLNSVVSAARAQGVSRLQGSYHQTAKNKMASEFYREHQFSASSVPAEHSDFELDLSEYEMSQVEIRSAASAGDSLG